MKTQPNNPTSRRTLGDTILLWAAGNACFLILSNVGGPHALAHDLLPPMLFAPWGTTILGAMLGFRFLHYVTVKSRGDGLDSLLFRIVPVEDGVEMTPATRQAIIETLLDGSSQTGAIMRVIGPSDWKSEGRSVFDSVATRFLWSEFWVHVVFLATVWMAGQIHLGYVALCAAIIFTRVAIFGQSKSEVDAHQAVLARLLHECANEDDDDADDYDDDDE